jgi:hypothetical protein
MMTDSDDRACKDSVVYGALKVGTEQLNRMFKQPGSPRKVVENAELCRQARTYPVKNDD